MAARIADLINNLNTTLKQVQDSGEYDHRDATYQRLRRAILLTIADLEEKERQRKPATAA